jgi:hypothetical protein
MTDILRELIFVLVNVILLTPECIEIEIIEAMSITQPSVEIATGILSKA